MMLISVCALGVLGLTTFSALILQTSTMIGQGEFLKGFIYFMMTQVFGFLALWLGVKLR